MKHLKLATAGLAFSLLILNGCKKDITANEDPIQQSVLADNRSVTEQAPLSGLALEKLKQLNSPLPEGFEERLKTYANQLNVHPQYKELVRNTMAVEPTACNGNTLVNQWLSKEIADWNNLARVYANAYDLLNIPTYDALLFANSSENQQFGINGEYTQRMTKTFKDLKRFWNITSDNMVLAAMHGDMLQDRDKLVRIGIAAYGLSSSDAEGFADDILLLQELFPQYRNGDHPIFTFNAFAMRSTTFQGIGTVPNKIIMGDGIMHAFSGIGYDDVAPQAILAHEFAHHIQFQLNLFTNSGTPEGTRRTELMADALAAYYLSHARGASMQWKRVQDFMQVFFNIGDCGFTSSGHHGTPTQRLAAAEWGYTIANEAQKQGHILTAQQFTALFEQKLPELIK